MRAARHGVPARAAYVSWFHAREGGSEPRVATVGDGRVGPALTVDAPAAQANLLGEYHGFAAVPDGARLAWVATRDGRAFDLVHGLAAP